MARFALVLVGALALAACDQYGGSYYSGGSTNVSESNY